MIFNLNEQKVLSDPSGSSVFKGEKDFNDIVVNLPDNIDGHAAAELNYVMHFADSDGGYSTKILTVDSSGEALKATATVSTNITSKAQAFYAYVLMTDDEETVIGKTNGVIVMIHPVPDEENEIIPPADADKIIKGLEEIVKEATETIETATDTIEAATEAISSKQNKLTAGKNITISDDNVISAEGGDSQIVSGVVNANGTITFTDSDGNTFATTGASVIGPDGFSPVTTVTQTASGATVSITDSTGTTTANISNGQDGNDYVLTAQDKAEIAGMVDVSSKDFDKPADGTAQADFNAEIIDSDDIYDYLDELIEEYPNYISKDILGKDSSGNYDVNRYVLFSGQYLAYEKETYPKMYAWKNGSTVIYSTSVSPRIGDILYSTTYIGTSAGTVSAVDNANESRTVGGTVYTRDKTSDVEPTLLFCKSVPDAYGKMPGIVGSSLYNSSGTRVGSIATIAADLQGRQVVTYGDGSAGNFTRQPFYDTNSLTERPNTIVIVANEHGPDYDPAEPAIICCRIMKKMCETGGDEFIHFLRSCKVVFVPVANPWGFNTKKHSLVNRYNRSSSYMNYNGRNFHRNFDTKGWTYSGEGSTETEAQAITRNANYGGSEIETQYLMDTMYGSTLGFAIHCMPTTEQSQGSMIIQSENISDDENFKALTAELWGKYQMFLTHSTDCDPDSYSKPSSYAIANCTNGGAMFEMNRRIRYTLPMHDSKILRADYQEMAGVIKIFAKRAGIWSESGSAYPDGDEVDW